MANKVKEKEWVEVSGTNTFVYGTRIGNRISNVEAYIEKGRDGKYRYGLPEKGNIGTSPNLEDAKKLVLETLES